MQSTISSKGQTTIPKEIRDHLRLKPGDKVKFFIHPDGHVVILPMLPVTALKGMLHARRRASLEEMAEAPVAGAAERYRRSLRS
ncbi:MAG: AbrB/MazE/SpoVT family DNA-binding domain-containing protein [Acidobacteria bacterium]|nr:MAG: AbrB/MazE/SpoVT family DNA-binding domain-containing protein [Acidobacteriota bacterium]